ncbi:MAG: hypothetical protein EOO77_14285 [Oxalobacteraceae bacterium]|nr:MAG: hypothetical protein EOO77_14285 [Oxalobacteraceae bacterium]
MNERELLKKIEPINKILESRFGIRVDVGSFEHLVDVRRLYESKRKVFLETMGAAQALRSPDYAKSVLISEAVHMILRELAPKRAKKNRK